MALTEKLSAIAAAIRAKTGKAEKLSLDQMPNEIAGIDSGGADPVLQEKTITDNGFYMPDDGYDGLSSVTVNVPIPEDSPLAIEVSTADEMTALLDTAPVGAIYKYVGTTTDKYENGTKYELCEE